MYNIIHQKLCSLYQVSKKSNICNDQLKVSASPGLSTEFVTQFSKWAIPEYYVSNFLRGRLQDTHDSQVFTYKENDWCLHGMHEPLHLSRIIYYLINIDTFKKIQDQNL